MTTLVWYRNDLRVTDHEPLARALQQRTPVVPVYIRDPRHAAATALGFSRTGPLRQRFIEASLEDLAASLERIGLRLRILDGMPEERLPALARETGARVVRFHEEACPEELDVEAAAEKALAPLGVAFEGHWGHTLHHPDDLPFTLDELPDVFTDFRVAVEKRSRVRETFRAPVTLAQGSPGADGTWPGGETAGLARLHDWLWTRDRLRTYKETRNGMLSFDDASRLSPWLSAGCLAPRTVYEAVRRYEAQRVRNESTYWLVFELLWRDFFRFVAARYGAQLFRRAGLRPPKRRGDAIPPAPGALRLPERERFEHWRTGTTGIPLVDANMRELLATGYLSNRGRQIVGSFLAHDLALDWRWGAAWFEHQLLDYDAASNWGNWAYVAGVGNDPRPNRHFNVLRQGEIYDPDSAYITHWLPMLASLGARGAQRPWETGRDVEALGYAPAMVALGGGAASARGR